MNANASVTPPNWASTPRHAVTHPPEHAGRPARVDHQVGEQRAEHRADHGRAAGEDQAAATARAARRRLDQRLDVGRREPAVLAGSAPTTTVIVGTTRKTSR